MVREWRHGNSTITLIKINHMLNINPLVNRIHEWGEPDQLPWKAMGLTRVSGIVLAAFEAMAALYKSLLFAWSFPVYVIRSFYKGICQVIVPIKRSQTIEKDLRSTEKRQIGNQMQVLAKLIVGLSSTLFFGIIFSPEINFRLHQKLGLAVDNAGLRKEKALMAKLEFEAKQTAFNKERNERLLQFQNEMEANRANSQDNAEEKNFNAEMLTSFYA